MSIFYTVLIVLTLLAVIYDIFFNIRLMTKKISVFSCYNFVAEYVIAVCIACALLKSMLGENKLIIIFLGLFVLLLAIIVTMRLSGKSLYRTAFIKAEDFKQFDALVNEVCEQNEIDKDSVYYSESEDASSDHTIIFKNVPSEKIKAVLSALNSFLAGKTRISFLSMVLFIVFDIGAIVTLYYFLI